MGLQRVSKGLEKKKVAAADARFFLANTNTLPVKASDHPQNPQKNPVHDGSGGK